MASTSNTSRTNNIQGRYGFAKLDDDIVLVQLLSSPTPRTYQAHIFCHDFVSVFSYSHTQSLSSNLLEIFNPDTDEPQKQRCWLEEDTATVFVAQDVMTRFIWLKDMLVPRMRVGMAPCADDDRRSGGRLRTGGFPLVYQQYDEKPRQERVSQVGGS